MLRTSLISKFSLKLNKFLFCFWIDGVDVLLDFNGFLDCRNDRAVVFNLFKGQYPPLSVFEPFTANLIPADLVFSHGFFDPFEILILIDVNF